LADSPRHAAGRSPRQARGDESGRDRVQDFSSASANLGGPKASRAPARSSSCATPIQVALRQSRFAVDSGAARSRAMPRTGRGWSTIQKSSGRRDMPGRGSDHKRRAVAMASSSGGVAPSAARTACSPGPGPLPSPDACWTTAPQRRQTRRAAPSRRAKPKPRAPHRPQSSTRKSPCRAHKSASTRSQARRKYWSRPACASSSRQAGHAGNQGAVETHGIAPRCNACPDGFARQASNKRATYVE